MLQTASASPASPPATASIVDSVRSCLIILELRAPRAERMASSRSRVAARARDRFATFAHAINNRKPTAARSIHRSRLTSPVIRSCRLRRITVQPALAAGYCEARRAWIVSMSERAAARVTPGFRRPTTRRKSLRRPSPLVLIVRGSQSSGATPDSGCLKPAGAMPTTTKLLPLSWMFLPVIFASPPRRRIQKSWLTIATRAAPGLLSSGTNERPIAGDTPNVEKKLAAITAPLSCSGSPLPVSVTRVRPQAVNCSKLWFCVCQSTKFGIETGSVLMLFPGLVSQIQTS